MEGHAATALQRHEPRRHTSLLNPHAWQYYGRCQLSAVWTLDMRQPVRRSAPSDPCSAPPTRHGRTQFICPWNLAPKIRRRGRRSHSSRLPRDHTDGRARTAAAAAPSVAGGPGARASRHPRVSSPSIGSPVAVARGCSSRSRPPPVASQHARDRCQVHAPGESDVVRAAQPGPYLSLFWPGAKHKVESYIYIILQLTICI
jgi:hypothetical protein